MTKNQKIINQKEAKVNTLYFGDNLEVLREKIGRIDSYEASGKTISQWKLKTSLNGAEIDLGEASAYIKTNEEKYSTNSKEALQSVESFLKRYFLQNTEELEKSVKEDFKAN